MSRAYNFSAGPATLPESVLAQARDEMLDWRGVGASIVELSHRGPEFMQVAAEAEADLRRLLSVPDDYAVLFLAGGATTQQALLPLNFAAPGQAVDYVVTGHWGKTALSRPRPIPPSMSPSVAKPAVTAPSPRAPAGRCRPMPPTSTSPPTRPSMASSSARFPTPATCRCSPT